MVRAHSIAGFLLLTLVISSCGPLKTASDVPTAAPVLESPPAPTAPPTSIPVLTADQIRNSPYQINARDDHPVVKLSNGQYQQGTDPFSPDYATVFVSDFIAFGALNADGINEAAVVTYENFGGTGNFAILALYRNENGAPVFVTSTLIDDRAKINALEIEDKEIVLDAIVHGSEDPGCCPALPTTRRYALMGGQLHLMNLSTATPNGEKRQVHIATPADGAEVTGSVQITGDVTIAPFESSLDTRIYDSAGNELYVGAIQVAAPALGGPGTFDTIIDLSEIPSGTTVFVELQDISAADGSLLAMDSVQLVVK